MTTRKWLFIFLYLLISCTLALNVMALITLLITRLFLLIFYEVPIEIEYVDLIKYAKAATFSGSLVSIGCWWIYYRHYRQNRKR